MSGGFRDDQDGSHGREAAPLNYVKFDIQAILAWASAARSNADRSEIIEEYAHNNVVNRRVVLHQMARDYKSLGSMELKANSGKTLLIRNPQFCSEGVSNKLVTTASNTIRKEWAKQRRYISLGCDIDTMSFVRVLNESMARRNYSILKEIQSRNDPEFPVSEEDVQKRYMAACVTNLSNPYRYLYQPDAVYGGRHGTDFMPQNMMSCESDSRVEQQRRATGGTNILALPEFSIPKKDQQDIRSVINNEISALSYKQHDTAGDDMHQDEEDNHEHLPEHHAESFNIQDMSDKDLFRKGKTEFFMNTAVDLFSEVSFRVENEFIEEFVYPLAEKVQVDLYAHDEKRPRLGETLSQLEFSKKLGKPVFSYFDDVVTSQRCISVNCIVAIPCNLARIAEDGNPNRNTVHSSISAVFDRSDLSRGGCQEHTRCMKHISKKDILLFRITLDLKDSDNDITKGKYNKDTLSINYSATVNNRIGAEGCFGDPLFTINAVSMSYIIRSLYTQNKVSKWLKRSEQRVTMAESAGSSPTDPTSCNLPFLRKPCTHKQQITRADGTVAEEEVEDNGVVGLSQGYMIKI